MAVRTMAASAGEAGEAAPGGPRRVRWAETIATTATQWKRTKIVEKDEGWKQVTKTSYRSTMQPKMVKPVANAAWARGGQRERTVGAAERAASTIKQTVEVAKEVKKHKDDASMMTGNGGHQVW